MNTVRRRDECLAAPLTSVRAARVVAPGQVEVVSTPAPEPAAGQAQLRPELVTLCGSDLRTVYSGGADAYPLPPGVSGHEIVARVTASDPAATAPDGLAPGTRVLALVTRQQGMAERFVTPCSDLIRLPDDLPAEHLVLAQQLGTVVFGCQRVGNVVARSAVVIGQGSAGLLFVAMLRRLGADRILVLDLSDARIAAGLRMGADEAYQPERDDPVPAWPRSPAAPWSTWWWRRPAPGSRQPGAAPGPRWRPHPVFRPAKAGHLPGRLLHAVPCPVSHHQRQRRRRRAGQAFVPPGAGPDRARRGRGGGAGQPRVPAAGGGARLRAGPLARRRRPQGRGALRRRLTLRWGQPEGEHSG